MAQLGAALSPASGSSTNWLHLFCRVLLLICSFLNIAAIALIGHWLADTISIEDVFFNSQVAGGVSAVLTLVLIPAMIIVARIRRNAWFVYIVTEIVVFGLLWISWTVTAALAIQDLNDIYLGNCSLWQLFPDNDWCSKLSATRDLAVTIFALLLVYVLTLTIYAVVRTITVGSGVWFQTVQDQRFGAAADNGRVAPTIDGTAPPSMWDSEKSANEVHSEVAPASVGGAIPGSALQGSPAPSSGVATYPPSALSKVLSMQMGAANSAGPNINAVGSSVTGLPAGAAGGPGVGTAQQYYSGAPQQVNMHVSGSFPQQQPVGNQGAPVTSSYPQL